VALTRGLTMPGEDAIITQFLQTCSKCEIVRVSKRYAGRTSDGHDVEVYARRGEQKVYGKILNGRYMDIEGEMVLVDVEFAGYWSGEGAVSATDTSGNTYQIRVTGRAD